MAFFNKRNNTFPLQAKLTQATKEMHKRNLLDDFVFAKTRPQIRTTHW
jgi:hypothetical protein